MAKYSKSEQADSLEYLKKILSPGDTVYCILRHVSRSGMMREISLYVIKDDVPMYLDHAAAVVLGYTQGKAGGVRVDGCGMDMGFHLVYQVASAVFRDGFICTGDHNCPSNDHHNPGPNQDNYTPHKHSDPGYALNYRWL